MSDLWHFSKSIYEVWFSVQLVIIGSHTYVNVLKIVSLLSLICNAFLRRMVVEGGRAERGRGGVLSYVKQACGCPLLCGVRTLFSGQFEHASVASLALPPLTHYTEPQQKLEYVASSLSAPPPHCSTLNCAPLPLLHTLTYTHRQPVQPTLGLWPPCHSNGARQTSILN